MALIQGSTFGPLRLAAIFSSEVIALVALVILAMIRVKIFPCGLVRTISVTVHPFLTRNMVYSMLTILYGDGVGCDESSTICCEFNNPPWFCKQLPQSTSDDIELRLCSDDLHIEEDTPIELVEIYIRWKTLNLQLNCTLFRQYSFRELEPC